MPHETSPLPSRKRIALIAHDERKRDLVEWARFNREALSRHLLFGTGTTAAVLSDALDLPVTGFFSGPLGGDQQIGAQIVEGKIDVMIFFWDPLASHPHDPDVRALLRVAVLQNIPVATNRASADFIFSSPLMSEPYERYVYDYAARLQRHRVIDRLQGE
jgi:methylglyoxal synthase